MPVRRLFRRLTVTALPVVLLAGLSVADVTLTGTGAPSARAAATATATLGTENYRASPGPVVGSSAYDYAPSIMVDGVYRMWWCGQMAGGKVPGDDILYAESTSLNGPFHVPGGTAPAEIVFDGTGDGSFDNEHTCDPSVVRANGTYYMYYSAEQQDGLPTTIGVASSSNGINWTRLNNDEPIITPADQQTTSSSYGAGQPSVIYLNGEFYLMFTDTTGAGAGSNGAGQFVWRSADPTFQTGVQVFTASGWQAKTTANSRSFSVVNAFSADWQYSDALGAFIIAHDNTPGETTLTFLDGSNLAVQPYAEVNIPGAWSEGPGIVSTPTKHAVPSSDNDCGQVPVDVIHASTGSPPEDLVHDGIDLLSGETCASMPDSQVAAIYDGYGLQVNGLPAAVVTGGERLQIASATVYTDLTRNRISVPSSIYYQIPYGASLPTGATVLGAPGRPGAFLLDNNTLWPVSALQLVTGNSSSITEVTDAQWDSYSLGPPLYYLY